jgi:hypothetical protein
MDDGENGDGLVTANTEQNSEQLTGRKRSLANLKPWPKGFCPNPKGRGPKPITQAYAKLAHKKVPGDAKGRTYAEMVAEGQYTAAGKGKTEAAREIADRLEGKAVQPVVGGYHRWYERDLKHRSGKEEAVWRRRISCARNGTGLGAFTSNSQLA